MMNSGSNVPAVLLGIVGTLLTVVGLYQGVALSEAIAGTPIVAGVVGGILPSVAGSLATVCLFIAFRIK